MWQSHEKPAGRGLAKPKSGSLQHSRAAGAGRVAGRCLYVGSMQSHVNACAGAQHRRAAGAGGLAGGRAQRLAGQGHQQAHWRLGPAGLGAQLRIGRRAARHGFGAGVAARGACSPAGRSLHAHSARCPTVLLPTERLWAPGRARLAAALSMRRRAARGSCAGVSEPHTTVVAGKTHLQVSRADQACPPTGHSGLAAL